MARTDFLYDPLRRRACNVSQVRPYAIRHIMLCRSGFRACDINVKSEMHGDIALLQSCSGCCIWGLVHGGISAVVSGWPWPVIVWGCGVARCEVTLMGPKTRRS